MCRSYNKRYCLEYYKSHPKDHKSFKHTSVNSKFPLVAKVNLNTSYLSDESKGGAEV